MKCFLIGQFTFVRGGLALIDDDSILDEQVHVPAMSSLHDIGFREFIQIHLSVRDSQKNTQRAITRDDPWTGLSERAPPDEVRQPFVAAI